MDQKQQSDYNQFIQRVSISTRSCELGWVHIMAEYKGDWIENILTGDDKNNPAVRAKSVDNLYLTMWMRNRVACSDCGKYQDLHIVDKNKSLCEYCGVKFTVYMEED